LSATLHEITRPTGEVDVKDLARELRELQDRVEDLEAEASASYQFIERLAGKMRRRARRGGSGR